MVDDTAATTHPHSISNLTPPIRNRTFLLSLYVGNRVNFSFRRTFIPFSLVASPTSTLSYFQPPFKNAHRLLHCSLALVCILFWHCWRQSFACSIHRSFITFLFYFLLQRYQLHIISLFFHLSHLATLLNRMFSFSKFNSNVVRTAATLAYVASIWMECFSASQWREDSAPLVSRLAMKQQFTDNNNSTTGYEQLSHNSITLVKND